MNQVERWIKISWLASTGMGQSKFKKVTQFLVEQQLTWAEVWQQVGRQKLMTELGLSQAQQASLQQFNQHFTASSFRDYLAQLEIEVVLIGEESYPWLLAQINDPPSLLFIKSQGKFEWETPKISIVGTRKPTIYGQRVTRDLTREFVNLGWCIVSGFMYGIDTLAHQVTLENGGQTIGVLGYGLGNFSPRSHRQLFESYLKQGMVFITEYPPWVQASKITFPRRNRIVAGLSLATLVTEGAAQSGTLITAHQAVEFGRVVGAVPGPITSPYSEGTRILLNEGAKLVARATDITQELSGWSYTEEKPRSDFPSIDLYSLTQTETSLLKLIRESDGVSVDQLCQSTNLEIELLLGSLNMLLLQNLVIQQGEKWFAQA